MKTCFGSIAFLTVFAFILISCGESSSQIELPDGVIVFVSCYGCTTCTQAMLDFVNEEIKHDRGITLVVTNQCDLYSGYLRDNRAGKNILKGTIDDFENLGLNTGNALVLSSNGTIDESIAITPRNVDSLSIFLDSLRRIESAGR